MGKDKLIYRQKYGKMDIENIAHDLWERHEIDLSTTGQGAKVNEKMFTASLRSNYLNEIRDGKDPVKAKRDAIKAYDKSAVYRDKADRYNQFKTYDLFGGDLQKGMKLQNKIRDARGRFERYDPNKLLYSHIGYDANGAKYEEYTYTPGNGKTIVLREYNSPTKWTILDGDGNEIAI